MDIDEVKRAFIKADDLAQKGDKQAAEDAKVFAQYIKSYKPATEATKEKSWFEKFTTPLDERKEEFEKITPKSVTDTAQNFEGLGVGAYDLARGMVLDMPMNIGMQVGGLISGHPASVARKSSQMAMEDVTSGITGRDLYPNATQSSTYNMMMWPFEKLTEGIDWAGNKIGELTGNKQVGEGSKIAMDIAGAVAPIPGTKLLGKGIRKLAEMDPTLRTEPRVPELDPEVVVAKRPEPKEYMGPLFEQGLKDVDTSTMSNSFGGRTGGRFLEGAELPPDATREPVRPENRLEEGQNADLFSGTKEDVPLQEMQREQNAFAGPDPFDTRFLDPQDLAVQYDPFHLKDLDKAPEDWQIKDNIERGREDFPAIDIQLLPERVAGDRTVTGLITKWNNVQSKLRDVYKEANILGMEGTRIREKSLGMTKKSKAEVNALKEKIAVYEKQLNNLSKQLQNRMSNKHGVDIEGMPMFKGVKERTDKTFSGAKYSNEAPSIKGSTERTTGLTVEKTNAPDMQRSLEAEVTNLTGARSAPEIPLGEAAREGAGIPDVNVERMDTPSFERDPTAKITNSGRIQKTNRPPLGLTKRGGSQAGKLDMSVFTESLGKILAGGKAIAKHAVTRDPNQYKKVPLSQADKIRMITGADARDPKTFVKEVLQNKENLVDISGETYPKGLLRKDLTPSAVGRLTYQNNPVISYISNRLNRIDGATKVAKEMALWGKGFGENWRGKPVKSKSDDGARTIMKTIPRARREGFRAAVNKYMDGKILEQMGLKEPTDSMLKADGLNTREIQSYRAARKQFDNIVDEINKALTAAGNKPIEKRPGYFPAMWMGDYRVFVKNAKGEVVKTLAFDHQFQVDMAIQKVKELDSTLKTEVSDAAKNKYNMKNSDLSAFQLASEVFQHDPKISKALDAARNEILQHRGALRHKLQKKGVEGYMGSEKGGFTDLEKAIDLYIEQAYNFLSDQQKRNMVGEVSKEFTDAGYSIQENLPNTQKYVNDILSNSIGASENMLKGFDRFLEYVGEFIATNGGIGGRRSAQRLLKTFNGIAGFYNLATAKQFAINAVQPLYALAKAQQLKVELGTDNIMMNMAKAYQEAFVHEKVSSMSKESRAALDFARKSGLIDARTLELINANTGEAASNLMKTAGHASSWWEQEAVRVPAYLFYDHMLRSVIKDPQARWEAASQLTEHTMVNYSKTQTPAIYGQMGIAGDAVRPYQQFTHNYHGQFAEYLQLAKREKKFSPLATFLAAQTTMAGLRGVVPLTAAAAFIAAYNSIPGVEELPTPEEALLGSGMSDTWVFGPLSKATGMNLSGSAGAPNILPTPGMPGLSMAGKIGSDVIGGGAKMLMGMDKEEDRMKMAQTLAPSAAKGFVEEAFMKDDGTVPNPRNDGMQSDLPIVRTPEEWRTRKWMGAEPYREGTQKARLRAAESSLKKESDYKNKLLDKIVDDYITKDEFDDKQLEEYLDKGGDPKSVITAVKSKQIKRILSKVESQMKDLPKQQKAKFMDAMEKYQVKLQDMSLEELKQEAE